MAMFRDIICTRYKTQGLLRVVVHAKLSRTRPIEVSA